MAYSIQALGPHGQATGQQVLPISHRQLEVNAGTIAWQSGPIFGNKYGNSVFANILITINCNKK